MSVRRHSKYYMLDGNFVIRAEDTLFRVHRSFLIKGDFWLGMLTPLGTESELGSADAAVLASQEHKEGTDDSNPLVVGNTADEFALLLSALYPSLPADWYSPEELITLLRLSDFYQFGDIHTYMLECLRHTEMSPLQALKLALEAGDHHWEADAYLDLCTRVTPIDVAAVQSMFNGRPGRNLSTLLHLRDVIRHHLYERCKHTLPSNRDCLGRSRPNPCDSVQTFVTRSLKDALGYSCTHGELEDVTLRALVLRKIDEPSSQDWEATPSKLCQRCRSMARKHIQHVLDYEKMRDICFKHIPWLKRKSVTPIYFTTFNDGRPIRVRVGEVYSDSEGDQYAGEGQGHWGQEVADASEDNAE